jgi:hypothetical protein
MRHIAPGGHAAHSLSIFDQHMSYFDYNQHREVIDPSGGPTVWPSPPAGKHRGQSSASL